MTYITRRKQESKFTTLPNNMLQRPDMSMKAKGLLAYLLSLPDNWRIFKSELQNHFKDGKDSISSAFDELTLLGYITRTELPKEKGKFGNIVYEVGDEPIKTAFPVKLAEADPPQRPARDGSPATDIPPLLNTDKQNTFNINKEGEFNFSKKDNHIRIREQIRTSSFFETVCMHNSIDKKYGGYLLDKFFTEQELNEEYAVLETEARSHFNRWTRLHKNKYLSDYRDSLEVKTSEVKAGSKGGAVL